MMGGGLGMGFGMGWFGLIFWIAIIALVIWGIKVISENRSANESRSSSHRAVEILKERYARGEIDREEFEARKRDIEVS